jgi:hypothetical protein
MTGSTQCSTDLAPDVSDPDTDSKVDVSLLTSELPLQWQSRGGLGQSTVWVPNQIRAVSGSKQSAWAFLKILCVLSFFLLFYVFASTFPEYDTALEFLSVVHLVLKGFMVWALCLGANKDLAGRDVVTPTFQPKTETPRYSAAEIDECMCALYGKSRMLKNMTPSRRAKLRFSLHNSSSSSVFGVCGKWNMGVPVPSGAQLDLIRHCMGLQKPGSSVNNLNTLIRMNNFGVSHLRKTVLGPFNRDDRCYDHTGELIPVITHAAVPCVRLTHRRKSACSNVF